MNKLGTRLILAMLAVAVFSAAVIIISQSVGARLYLLNLPTDLRAELLERSRRGPPWRSPFGEGPPPSAFLDDDDGPPDFMRRDDFVLGLANLQDYQRRATLIGFGIAALLASLIAMYLARTISRPIERVSEAAAGVAEGDLSVRVQAQTSTVEVQTLTQNFNTMATSLQSGEQQRRAMIADIAHELRTPLAAMKLRFQALEDDLLPFDKTQVQRLHLQTDLLTRLVQDLRTLSLADEGRLSLRKQDIDLVELLNDVCDSYQVKAAAAQVRLEFEANQASLNAHVDRERVAQILSNLLDNALRITPAGGAVKVGLEGANDRAVMTVTDTGPGLSPDKIEHLFDRFFQDRDKQSAAQNQVVKGNSGLGLAIVKTLAELHGGHITASNTDAGAQFELRLPRHV